MDQKYVSFISILSILIFSHCNSILNRQALSQEKPLPLIDSVFTEGNKYFEENYERFEYRIPMRDGATLFTLVYIPKDRSQDYPIMFLRTPYSSELSRGNYAFRQYRFGLSQAFYEEKFIFVYQDVRGKFMSEGEYENMRPQLTEYKDSNSIDESTDTFDTIEWLIHNIENNNGNVGMYGISYPGFYAAVGAINAHPALKAVSPQAPIADWFWDDFHHNGAFMLNAAYGFFGSFGIPRPAITKNWPQSLAFEEFEDGYQFYLNELVPLKNINEKYYQGKVPFWNQFIDHPNYDKFWQERSILPHLKNIQPAVMTVGGWFDAEDLYGPLKVYEAIEENSAAENHNFLVMGPWFHGGWARTWGMKLGDIYFGENPAPSKFYQDSIELPFFKHYLKGDAYHNLPEAYVFETGNNRWRKFDSWLPRNLTNMKFFLSKNNRLAQEESTGFSEYISDPKNPVPFTAYITNDIPKKYMVDDQRFAAERKDVLFFETTPLTEDLTVAGDIIVELLVEMTGTDADFIVKLIDVYPENIADEIPYYDGRNMEHYQQMVRADVMRGRFRNSFEYPEPFESNKVTMVKFELLDILHTFKKGHKIMVQVQSTWFPLVDINPQKYVENIYKADEKDFVKSTIKIHHSKEFPSSIALQILTE